jgi:hypothetical protein
MRIYGQLSGDKRSPPNLSKTAGVGNDSVFGYIEQYLVAEPIQQDELCGGIMESFDAVYTSTRVFFTKLGYR